MAAIPIRIKSLNTEREDGFRRFRGRTYFIPDGSTLSDDGIDLQQGDTLPVSGDSDGASWEIIESRVVFLKPRTGNGAHRGGRAAQVTALLERVEVSDSTPWKELTGTRRILDSDPQTLQYEITFTAATGTARPTAGQTYLQITTDASGFTTSGLDREPVVVSVSKTEKATINKAHVIVVFEANHARTVTASPGTELNPRILIRTGQNTHKGRRRFSSTLAAASAVENSVYNSLFPGKSGKYAPRCYRVEIQDNWKPGRSLIIADFETPRVVGEGRLRIKTGTSARTVTRDLNNKIITGPEETSPGSKRYNERRLVSGKAIQLDPTAIIIVETAATSFNIDTIIDRIGSVNKNKLPNFGGAEKGTLLFLGAPETTYEFVGNLWHVNLAFQYSGNPKKHLKWNEMTVSQAGTFFPRRVDGVDADGVKVEGATKYLLEWAPRILLSGGGLADSPAAVTHKMWEEADFRDIGKDLLIVGVA